jgi:hypothetical protein
VFVEINPLISSLFIELDWLAVAVKTLGAGGAAGIGELLSAGGAAGIGELLSAGGAAGIVKLLSAGGAVGSVKLIGTGSAVRTFSKISCVPPGIELPVGDVKLPAPKAVITFPTA